MPTTQAHQNKQSKAPLALFNLQQSQNSPHHADWIVTLAFYKALHSVDSYLPSWRFIRKGIAKEIGACKNILEVYIDSMLRCIERAEEHDTTTLRTKISL